ncbi:MAG TPA: hypothetical protein VG013_13180 [Gemmataceae bacterium]|jgi:hypothetical protein|nr:hypothetical protein [Gemmataceae bacterium]
MKFSLHGALPALLGLLASLGLTGVSRSQTVQLREKFPAGYQYHVSTRVELSGTLTLPPVKGKPAPKPLSVKGDSVLDYDERVLAAATDGQVERTVRVYRRVDFQRNVGDRPQQSTLRPEVRRLVLLRHKQLKVPFSPDGPLTWGEIDLVRTDVFTPALAGLLPEQAVGRGDRWNATASAVQELTDLERVEAGGVECRLEEITTLDRRRYARVALKGSVRGVNQDGPNRQQLDGYFFFDLESQHLSYLSLKGVHVLLDKDGKEVGRVEGRFVLTRRTGRPSTDLGDEALRGVTLEPNADNTMMLYDNPAVGIRFLYPRRWRVAGVRGRQVALDEARGSGLLFTLEPAARVPTGAQFLGESRAYFKQQTKVKVLRVEEPRQLQRGPRELERFALDLEVAGKPERMDYFVLRQASGGATLAARLLPADLANLRKDVERIARSAVISRPVAAEGKK